MILKDDMTAEERANNNRERWLRAMKGGHEDYIANAKNQERYYKTQHWSEDELAALAVQNRPPVTLNHIYNTVQIVLGEASTREASIRYLPVNSTDGEMADVMSRVAHQILSRNNYQRVERKVMFDSVVLDGRGYLNIGIDYSDNKQGDIKLTALDPLSVVLDPDASDEDPDTWSEMFIFNVYTVDQLAEMYGEERAQMAESQGSLQVYNDFSVSGADIVDLGQNFGGVYGYDRWNAAFTEEDRKRRTRGYRAIERQWRCFKSVWVGVHPDYGDEYLAPMSYSDKKTFPLEGEMYSEIEVWAMNHDLMLVKRMRPMVRVTVSTGNVLLYDDWSHLGDKYSVIPLFPAFRRGEPVGMLRTMLSPQDLTNKSASQMLHDINMTSNSGWLIPEGTLGESMSVGDLEERGGAPGLVVEFNPQIGPPVKIQPNPIPQGLLIIKDMAEMHLKSGSGLGDAIRGQSHPSASGTAIGESIQASSISLRPYSIALKWLRETLGRTLLWCMQHYTRKRVSCSSRTKTTRVAAENLSR